MRLLHISDLHIEPVPERTRPGVVATLDSDAPALRAVGADLTIVTGDLTTWGFREAEHLILARQWLDGLDIPYLAVPGNHDMAPVDDGNGGYEDVPFAETRYAGVFGPDPLTVHDLGALRVIGAAPREGDPDGVLPALEKLVAADDRPVVIATHYPVVPPREVKVHTHFGSDAYLPTTASTLRELIARHSNVALYLCGHVHVNSMRRVAPHCTQHTAGSLGQGATGYRVFDIDGDRATYATVLGSGPMAFWADGDQTYHFGTDVERTGTVPWPTR